MTIPEGQTEALIPMNANGNAEVRTWKVVVDGFSGSREGGFLSVSSQMVDLTIAEPFVALSLDDFR